MAVNGGAMCGSGYVLSLVVGTPDDAIRGSGILLSLVASPLGISGITKGVLSSLSYGMSGRSSSE